MLEIKIIFISIIFSFITTVERLITRFIRSSGSLVVRKTRNAGGSFHMIFRKNETIGSRIANMLIKRAY